MSKVDVIETIEKHFAIVVETEFAKVAKGDDLVAVLRLISNTILHIQASNMLLWVGELVYLEVSSSNVKVKFQYPIRDIPTCPTPFRDMDIHNGNIAKIDFIVYLFAKINRILPLNLPLPPFPPNYEDIFELYPP